jgi:hypothetical protein
MNAILEIVLAFLLEAAIMVPGHFVLDLVGWKANDVLAFLVGILLWAVLGALIWAIVVLT